MDYLGLGPDDAYDDYDLPPEPERAPRSPSAPRGGYSPDQEHGVRAVPPPAGAPDADYATRLPRRATEAGVTARAAWPGLGGPPRERRPAEGAAHRAPAAVRPGPGGGRQVQEGQPVIMNLEEATATFAPPHRLRQRAVLRAQRHDGEGGHGVYLLKPANVSDEDRRQMASGDFDDLSRRSRVRSACARRALTI